MTDDVKYVAVAPLSVVQLTTGSAVSLYAGAPVPRDATDADVARLLAEGFIAPDPDGVFVGGVPNDDPAQVLVVSDDKVVTKAEADAVAKADDVPGEVDDVDGDGPIPAKSAAKDVWVAYAVSQGAEQIEAESQTKDDLIAAYGAAPAHHDGQA